MCITAWAKYQTRLISDGEYVWAPSLVSCQRRFQAMLSRSRTMPAAAHCTLTRRRISGEDQSFTRRARSNRMTGRFPCGGRLCSRRAYRSENLGGYQRVMVDQYPGADPDLAYPRGRLTVILNRTRLSKIAHARISEPAAALEPRVWNSATEVCWLR